MNTRLKFVIIFFLICLPFFVPAQDYRQYEIGTPFIRNYPPREYKAFSQNWQILQDKRGVMYFANGDGVLEYDGVNWRLIRTKGNYTVSALAIDKNGVIFVGSINEFGYLAPDVRGLMQYYSLTDFITNAKLKIGFIYNIFVVGDNELIITSSESIFKLSFENNQFKIKEFLDVISFYKVNDKLYAWGEDYGLGVLVNDSVIPLKGGSFFKEKSIQTIIEFDEKNLLILTRRDGFYIVNKIFAENYNKNIDIEHFQTQIDEFLIKNRFNFAQRLNNGTFAFATSRAGTVVMDKRGNLIQILNKSIGIYNDTHYYIYQDAEDALWLALDNGISKAETNSPISFWNDATGLKGSVLSVTRFENVLYAATWQGAFFLDVSGFNKDANTSNLDILIFKPVKGITATCWDFTTLKFGTLPPVLLAVSTEGIFRIEKDTAILIYSVNTNRIHQLKKRPDIIVAGLENGAAVIKLDTLDKNSIKFGKPEYIEDIAQRIISIGETKNNDLWLGTQYNGLIHLKENKLESDTISKNFTPVFHTMYNSLPLGGSVYINMYMGRLLFACENGLFYITSNNKIKPYSSVLNSILRSRGVITVFKEDFKGNLWLQGTQTLNGEKIIFCVEKKNNKKIFNSIPFKPVPKAEVWCFYPEENDITWLCSDEGLYRYNPNVFYFYQKHFNSLIRKVTLENDSIFYGGADSFLLRPFNIAPEEDIQLRNFNENKIKYKYNSVMFEFASLFFYDEGQNKYRYKLEGFDKKWSDWISVTKKEYTNLPQGNYVFRVYSKNIFEEEGKEASFAFEILSPWYRTYWAYTMFFLILASIVYLIIKYSNKRLVEAKFKLENMVQERTSEIILQKKEIEKEKEKSDRLLLNILPYKIAEELKENGFAKAKYYKLVSVMFADFTGFTQIAEQMEPEELIKELNKCFVFFDEVCVRHNIEKIKTVGDSYMCAGGVPIKNCTNPVDIILAALEMIHFINKLQQEQLEKGLTPWHIRIGINTGEIIAGVVGKKKFAYDIWGDTVNTASRLETTSEPDKINISGATYRLVKDFFVCEYRGKVPAKHKGEVDMNFVYRIKPELSHDEEGYIPNLNFKEMYNQLSKEC